MQFVVVFDRHEMRPEIFLAASWRNIANQKSPIDGQTKFSYWCSCDRLSLTVYILYAISTVAN
jgi:hypothetical protein